MSVVDWSVLKRFFSAGCLALLLLTPRAAMADDEVPEEARLYFRNGVELLSQAPPNYQDAYYQFKLAYEKSNSWKVLGNLGLCALNLERDGEAVDHYRRYLAEGGNNVDPEEAATLKRELLLLEGNLAYVTLSSDVAELQITDKRAGTSIPPQRYRLQNGKLELRVRAGTHTIEARQGDGVQKWEIVLDPAQRETHTFSFGAGQAAAAPESGATASAPASDDRGAAPAGESSGGLRTVGFVSAGVGVAALAGGVVTGLIAKGNETDAREFCQGDVCEEQARDKFDSAQSMATLTNILLVSGAVFTATGVTLILVGGPSQESPKPAARLELKPAVAPGGMGFFAQGRF